MNVARLNRQDLVMPDPVGFHNQADDNPTVSRYERFWVGEGEQYPGANALHPR
jgi:hypothetical protein